MVSLSCSFLILFVAVLAFGIVALITWPLRHMRVGRYPLGSRFGQYAGWRSETASKKPHPPLFQNIGPFPKKNRLEEDQSIHMAKPYPDELNAAGFEAYVLGCSEKVQEILAYLRSTAKNAGADVFGRRQKPQSGCGITYYANGEWFCQFHPKPDADHVQVLIKGVTTDALKSAGVQPSEHRTDQQLWIPIKTMLEAVRLVRLILSAHDALGA
jgi:hypothetical protein